MARGQADDVLSQTLRALGQPDRLRLLRALLDEPASPVRLAKQLDDIPLGSVSYHVRQLAEAGLVELTETVPRRGAIEHIYAITPRGRAGLRSADALAREL